MARKKCWHGAIEVHPGTEGQEGYACCANCGARMEARLAEKPKGKVLFRGWHNGRKQGFVCSVRCPDPQEGCDCQRAEIVRAGR